jgi:uncharacterized membrane protein
MQPDKSVCQTGEGFEMTVLIWGMVLFFGAHFLSLTPARAPLHARLGEKTYKGVYSIVSLVGLGLMIWGFGLARSGPDAARIVYDPVMGSSHGTMLLVLLAMVLLASAHMKGYIRKIVKHPMSVGVALWSAGHLMVNGNFSEVLLFGGFFVLSCLISSSPPCAAKSQPTRHRSSSTSWPWSAALPFTQCS